jgi:uncharacterized membrane protein
MKSRFRVLMVLAALLTVFSLASAQQEDWYTEDIELSVGESQELGDYTLTYEGKASGTMLELKYTEDDSDLILAQFEQETILESPRSVNYSSREHGISFRVQELDFEDDLYLNISVSSRENIFTDSELSTTAPDHLIGRRNGDIEVPLHLENQGVANATYQLTTENETQLEVNYGYDSFNISELQLEAGESQELDAVIEIPESATKGIHDLAFVADTGARKFTESVEVEVRGEEKERRLNMDLRENFKNIKAGEQVNVPVTVINRGEVELQDINVTTTLPDGWESTVQPRVVDSLRPRYGRERATVTVTPPADISPGDYFVEFSAHSSTVSVEESKELRIHVREKSGLAWVGGVVMAFSILLLVVVQRRFKRR